MNLRKLILVLAFSLVLGSCAGDPINPACDGNVSNSGFSVFVELLSADAVNATYLFTICDNINHKGSVLSVYGGDNLTEIDLLYNASYDVLESRAGDPPLIDSSKTGTSFEVTLPSDNVYFALYEAELDGPLFILGNKVEILRGELIP